MDHPPTAAIIPSFHDAVCPAAGHDVNLETGDTSRDAAAIDLLAADRATRHPFGSLVPVVAAGDRAFQPRRRIATTPDANRNGRSPRGRSPWRSTKRSEVNRAPRVLAVCGTSAGALPRCNCIGESTRIVQRRLRANVAPCLGPRGAHAATRRGRPMRSHAVEQDSPGHASRQRAHGGKSRRTRGRAPWSPAKQRRARRVTPRRRTWTPCRPSFSTSTSSVSTSTSRFSTSTSSFSTPTSSFSTSTSNFSTPTSSSSTSTSSFSTLTSSAGPGARVRWRPHGPPWARAWATSSAGCRTRPGSGARC